MEVQWSWHFNRALRNNYYCIRNTESRWSSKCTLRSLLQQWLEVSAFPPKSIPFIKTLPSQGLSTIHLYHCELVIEVISSVSPSCEAMVIIWHHPCKLLCLDIWSCFQLLQHLWKSVGSGQQKWVTRGWPERVMARRCLGSRSYAFLLPKQLLTLQLPQKKHGPSGIMPSLVW